MLSLLPSLSSEPLSPFLITTRLTATNCSVAYLSVHRIHQSKKKHYRERERKRDDELYKKQKKKEKKSKKRTRHTSASSTIVKISADSNDTFTNKTMTGTFSYIRNNETTYTSENVQATHAQLPTYV